MKIDQSFVAALGKPGHYGAMVGALIALAHTLDMTTIAEGVETPRRAHELSELGAGLAQGYRFSRPQPASTIGALLEHQAAGRPGDFGEHALIRSADPGTDARTRHG